MWTSTISSTPFRRRSSFFLIFFSTFRSYHLRTNRPIRSSAASCSSSVQYCETRIRWGAWTCTTKRSASPPLLCRRRAWTSSAAMLSNTLASSLTSRTWCVFFASRAVSSSSAAAAAPAPGRRWRIESSSAFRCSSFSFSGGGRSAKTIGVFCGLTCASRSSSSATSSMFAAVAAKRHTLSGGSGFEPIPEPPWRTREMRSPDDTSDAMSSSPLSPASGWRRKRLRRPSPPAAEFWRVRVAWSDDAETAPRRMVSFHAAEGARTM